MASFAYEKNSKLTKRLKIKAGPIARTNKRPLNNQLRLGNSPIHVHVRHALGIRKYIYKYKEHNKYPILVKSQ